MDIDTGTFQSNLLGSQHAFSAANAAKLNNASLSGGLMRYHSAPSSVLAGLLDDDFFPASDDSEFAQLLSDGIGSFSSLLDPKGGLQLNNRNKPDFSSLAKEEDVSSRNEPHPPYFGSGSTFQERLSQNPLSAISEYGLEETVDDFCLPLSSGVAQQGPCEPGNVDGTSYKSSGLAEMQVNAFKSGLIRQSSSPAEALSRLVMEESSDNVKLGCGFAAPHLSVTEETILPTPQLTIVNNAKCSNVVVSTISSPRRPKSLLRQSSSPAGLLSQVNIEDFLVVKENRRMDCTPGVMSAEAMRDRKGHVSGRGHALGTWDDNLAEQAMQHFIDLGQRKRGRSSPVDIKLLKALQRSPVEQLATVTTSSFSPPSSSSPGSVDCMEGPAEESVLCKARAKRGCATHPRSIAERQRRIKISERMKKLQDLVPNLDKQASTAEMLDEVVEYVKHLQRQVQELSLNGPKCTGSCQQSGGSPQ